MIGDEEVEFLHERQHYKVYFCRQLQTIFIVDKVKNVVLDEIWADGVTPCIKIVGEL